MYGEKFLKILKASLKGTQVNTELNLTESDIREILLLAETHKVLPLVFDAAYSLFPEGDRENIRVHAKLLVSRQALATERFLASYKALNSRGLYPLVVKGIVCRELYPNPDLRCSSDEDLLMEADSADLYPEIMSNLGLSPLRDREDGSYQQSYMSTSGLYIELHRSLFPLTSPMFEKYNLAFEDAHKSSISVTIGETRLRTLSHTHHMLFLILHALKHFLHSGVGIRQVCDISLYANAFGKEIDWGYVFEKCAEVSASDFAAALFKIGSRYLTLDYSLAGIPLVWQESDTDELPLLEDILTGGIYGTSQRARQHSSGFTLDAASGKKPSLKNRLFPSGKNLPAQYGYAAKNPVLLPIAWSQRLFRYGMEIDTKNKNTPLNAVKIGNQRLQLLKKYNILP